MCDRKDQGMRLGKFIEVWGVAQSLCYGSIHCIEVLIAPSGSSMFSHIELMVHRAYLEDSWQSI
jgi:hypothetical protein